MRVVYSVGRYYRQARRICDATIEEIRQRGWLVHLRSWEDADEEIADCDLFHSHSVLSLRTLRYLRSRRPGVRIVLQRDSAHVACPGYRDEVARLSATVSASVQAGKIPAQTEEYSLADVVLVNSRYVAETFTAQGYSPERLEIRPCDRSAGGRGQPWRRAGGTTTAATSASSICGYLRRRGR